MPHYSPNFYPPFRELAWNEVHRALTKLKNGQSLLSHFLQVYDFILIFFASIYPVSLPSLLLISDETDKHSPTSSSHALDYKQYDARGRRNAAVTGIEPKRLNSVKV